MFKHILTTFLLAFAGVFMFGAEVINIDDSNPPFMYLSVGKPTGVYPMVAAAAFKKMGVEVTVAGLPWKRVLQDTDEGKAGVIGLYKNADREKKYDFSDMVFIERLMVFFNKTGPIPYTKIEDLKGKKVGVIRGWSYGDAFDAAAKAGMFTTEEVASDAQNFQKLSEGRINAVIAINESGVALMAKFKNVGYSPTPLLVNPTFLAFNKSAGKGALLKQFDTAIRALKTSGEFQKIVQAEVTK